MYDLFLIVAVVAPPLAAHLLSRYFCTGFDQIDYDGQARRCYLMSWVVSICIFIQIILPMYLVGAYAKQMSLTKYVVLGVCDGLLQFDKLPSWLGLTLVIALLTSLFAGYCLLTAMAWYRLDRMAKKNRDAAPVQARLYLRQFVGAMIPGVCWGVISPMVGSFDSQLIVLLALAGYLLLFFSLAPLLVRIANPTAPLENDAVNSMVQELYRKAGVRCGKVRVLSYGKVQVANAMVSGLLPWYRRIFVTDLLLEKFTPEEIEGILAHEVAHIKKRHLLWLAGFGFAGSALIVPVAGYLAKLNSLPADTVELLALLFYWGVLFKFCSRIFERQADRGAVELTGNKEAFTSALIKLAELNFTAKKWGKWDIFQTHPDVERRIEYLRSDTAPTLGQRHVPLLPVIMAVILCLPAVSVYAKEKINAPLVEAIVAIDTQKTAALLESGAYIEQCNEYGTTPLMAAVNVDDNPLVSLLLARGANVHARNSSGKTPLFIAAANGNSPLVKMFLGAGSSVDSADIDGNTPLMAAAHIGDVASVTSLLEYGADYRKTNAQKQTLLMQAAVGGNIEIVSLFLDRKIPIDVQDAEGFTALIHALPHPETARYLVEKGADPSTMVTVKKGDLLISFPLLAMAVIVGGEKSMATLIELGAKINEKGSYGITPLLAACVVKNMDSALLLLNHGAEPDVALQSIPEEPEVSGATPLIFAASAGNTEVVRRFLQKGVQVNRRSDAGITALMVAEMGGHVEVAELLRTQGATMTENERNAAEEVRKQAFDARARSDAMNAHTCLEAYLSEHQSYPASLAQTSFNQSEGVTVNYEPMCTADGCHSYVVTVTTSQGGHEYKAFSGSTQILNRALSDRSAGWEG